MVPTLVLLFTSCLSFAKGNDVGIAISPMRIFSTSNSYTSSLPITTKSSREGCCYNYPVDGYEGWQATASKISYTVTTIVTQKIVSNGVIVLSTSTERNIYEKQADGLAGFGQSSLPIDLPSCIAQLLPIYTGYTMAPNGPRVSSGNTIDSTPTSHIIPSDSTDLPDFILAPDTPNGGIVDGLFMQGLQLLAPWTLGSTITWFFKLPESASSRATPIHPGGDNSTVPFGIPPGVTSCGDDVGKVVPTYHLPVSQLTVHSEVFLEASLAGPQPGQTPGSRVAGETNAAPQPTPLSTLTKISSHYLEGETTESPASPFVTPSLKESAMGGAKSTTAAWPDNQNNNNAEPSDKASTMPSEDHATIPNVEETISSTTSQTNHLDAQQTTIQMSASLDQNSAPRTPGSDTHSPGPQYHPTSSILPHGANGISCTDTSTQADITAKSFTSSVDGRTPEQTPLASNETPVSNGVPAPTFATRNRTIVSTISVISTQAARSSSVDELTSVANRPWVLETGDAKFKWSGVTWIFVGGFVVGTLL